MLQAAKNAKIAKSRAAYNAKIIFIKIMEYASVRLRFIVECPDNSNNIPISDIFELINTSCKLEVN